MAYDIVRTAPEAERMEPQRNQARASVRFGSFQAHVELDVTPRGLLAVGGLVSVILLSVVPIVVAATRKVPPAD